MTAQKSTVLSSKLFLGVVTILILGLAVYLSYIAENGLPFIPTYRINVQVANADELYKNADVRIGGARVGQILTITPEPPSRAWPHPYAQLGLALQTSLQPLPADTHYRVRLASVLGAKYLELIPGHRRSGAVPDGGTLALNTNPRLTHELPFVDLDQALQVFAPRTRAALRSLLGYLGDSVAGRGSDLNDIAYSLARLLAPLQRVLGVLAAPADHLGGLITGASQTTAALAAVAPEISSLLDHAASTFQAVNRRALGQAINQLPGTESVASSVLQRALPTLSDAAGLVRQLRPGAQLLPRAARYLDRIVTTATPVFAPVPKLAGELKASLAAVSALAADPASTKTFQALGRNDLATLGSSAFVGLGAILRAVAGAQFACNVTDLWLRNFASGLTEGDSAGSWLRVMPVVDQKQSTQLPHPASDLHDNYYPIENLSQCQAGNEGYTGTRLIGHPPGTSTVVDNTTPPPGVLARGMRAGLVP
ncbi:MAG TPA: MlaD family protein [Solirubrobacteraceae bacterium]|nr:MlaD family protein [Solirubrobacteraceae bacterium]